MDGKSIWPGFDYAWTRYPSRGVDYYENASRVKAITTLDRVEPGNTRNTTFVKVIRLTNEGEPRTKQEWDSVTSRYTEVEFIDEVKARELFMRWDEYEDETETREQHKAEEAERRRLIREREEREYAERERIRKEREERERLEHEERQRKERLAREERLTKVYQGLERIGLGDGVVDTYSQKVTMTFDQFLEWIASLEKVDCETCDRKLVRIPQL